MRVTFFGAKLRSLRRQAGLTQAALAARLGISPSYLNLLENDRRPLTAELLLSLSKVLDIDLRTLAEGPNAQLLADVTEALSDPVLEEHPLTGRDVRAFVETAPDVARALVRLHHAYIAARGGLEALQTRLLDEGDFPSDITGMDRSRLSSEQVSDFFQRHLNHFPELENQAERLWRMAKLDRADLFGGLARYLEGRHGISVKVLTVREMDGAARRYLPARREIQLSEALPRRSRNFEMAAQICLLEHSDLLNEIVGELPEESHRLARVALANYFASAVLMPYEPFHQAAEMERYDVELLGHRFDASFEQVCHRLTTLRRPGAEGVDFFFIRVDIAGNISKRFSAAGVQFPRYSGLCALWNVHGAFLQPGRLHVQVARMPDNRTILSIAKTVQRHKAVYRSPESLYAVAIGCDSSDAHRLIYSDGLDIHGQNTAVPVGITCRLCDRVGCAARAMPAIHRPLRIDENVRTVSIFAPGT